MVLYKSSLGDFRDDVDNNQITEKIRDNFYSKLGFNPNPSEQVSWNNSLRFMETAVRKAKLPDNCGVLIEYRIPTTSKRIDLMVTGQNADGKDNFVIVELKQWSSANKSSINHLVRTYVGRGYRDVLHPSYQALLYQNFLNDLNEEIQNKGIRGQSCAYLHNYKKRSPEPLEDNVYSDFLELAPIFFQNDVKSFQDYLFKHLCKGNGLNIQRYMEQSRPRPSKKLVDKVASLFHGNEDFILLDEQVVAYETICHEARNRSKHKKVIIVEGGPGTGKSVVSLNVFNSLLSDIKNIKFVAPNAAFRSAIIEKLVKGKVGTKTYIKTLFMGSASFYEEPTDYYDVIVVDEAHRLKKQGAFQYRGKNQVDDIVNASIVSVFFVDDTQRIRPDDVGGVDVIEEVAKKYGAEVKKLHLTAQFRCSGADGYINWLTDVLQIEETGNYDGWDENEFEFEILDSPHDVYERIKEKNDEGNFSRVLAGYAWPWTTAKNGNPDGEIADVVIDEHAFELPWNSRNAREYWAIRPEGLHQVGCVHTSQGLEFDYVGVLFGNDIKFNPETGQIYADYNSYYDTTGKKNLKDNPDQLTKYIKNIYKVLCSRGIKGCFIYVRDPELRKYINNRYCIPKENKENLEEELFYEGLERIAEKPEEYFSDR